MAPHSSTFAWKILWTEEPGGLQSMGLLRVGHDWATSLSLSCIGEGNGNPLQCSCLENPRDGCGAWWAAIMGSHRVGHDWSDLAAAAAAAVCVYVCLKSLCFPLIRIHMIVLRAHPDNPELYDTFILTPWNRFQNVASRTAWEWIHSVIQLDGELLPQPQETKAGSPTLWWLPRL